MANKETKRLGNKGFSLVELIVVIAIMAVLVGVLAPQFIRYVEKSRQSGDVTSIQQVMTAIETSAADGVFTAPVEIKLTANSTTATVSGGGSKLSDALAESGLTTSITLRSTGWPQATLKYDTDTFKWSLDPTNAANSKGPKTELKTLVQTTTQNK